MSDLGWFVIIAFVVAVYTWAPRPRWIRMHKLQKAFNNLKKNVGAVPRKRR